MARNKFVKNSNSTPTVNPTTTPGPPTRGKSAPKRNGAMAATANQQTVSLPAGKPTTGHTVTDKNCY